MQGFFKGAASSKGTLVTNSNSSTMASNSSLRMYGFGGRASSSGDARDPDDTGYSDLVYNTDKVFAGNPLKALKHKRSNMFARSESTGVTATGIDELISTFKQDTETFKASMSKLDLRQKIKDNQERIDTEEGPFEVAQMTPGYERRIEISKDVAERMSLTSTGRRKPIKAERIVFVNKRQ